MVEQDFVASMPSLLLEGIRLQENSIIDYKKEFYNETFKNVSQTINPVLEGLAVPRIIGIGELGESVYVGGDTINIMKELEFPPKFTVNGKDYYINVRQIESSKAKVGEINFFGLGDSQGSLPLARLRLIPFYLGDFYAISDPKGLPAGRRELDWVIDLAKAVSEEAPKQAFENGFISKNWIQATLEGKQKASDEGLPRRNWNEHALYELITTSGTRVVAKPDHGSNLWIEANGKLKIDSDSVSGWRRLRKVLPEYHLREMNPMLYSSIS